MSSMTTAVDAEASTRVGANRLIKYGLFAVIAASVVNALFRVIALAVVDIPAAYFPLPLGWGPVLASSAIGAVGATVVYGVITRYATRPNRTFTIVAAVVLVLSFGNLLTPALAGAPLAVYAILAVMHVTAAVAIVAVLTRAPIAADTSDRRQ